MTKINAFLAGVTLCLGITCLANGRRAVGILNLAACAINIAVAVLIP